MFYCGIDLSATSSHICVVDESLAIHLQQKVRNELPRIIHLLQPFGPDLQIVVESTFNWYWLADGLLIAGFNVSLAHSLGLRLITQAKVKTDTRDAFTLAKLLRAGAIPKAYIYPRDTRPLRDLLRRRLQIVRLRSREYGRLRQLLLCEGILTSSRNQIKRTDEEELAELLSHPLVALHASQEVARIKLYSEQIAELEASLHEKTDSNTDYKRLTGIAGIGKVLALTILYEVGEIARFQSARHFCSYCRVVPGVAQSGAVSRRGRGSKQGNAYLKWAFLQAAVAAVRFYPKIRRCFERHMARHRGSGAKIVAYNVIAHKLAQAVYYVLRDSVEYQEERLFG